MKVALVHDYLNQFGGGERVLLHLMKMFPEAPVFTLLHDPAKTRGLFAGRVRRTSFLDIPLVRRAHRFFIPLMPLATTCMNLGDEFDLVISDTHGFVKGIRYGKKTKHLSYCHTPLRYAWEPEEYFGHSVASKLFRLIFAPAFAYVRRFDYRAGQKPDVILSNSEFIREKVARYYGRDSQVLYPPVDTAKFYFDGKVPQDDYFLAFGRFMRYKRFDVVIEAFNKLGLPLKIAGAGRDEARLRRLVTSPKIEFLPFQESDDDVRQLYAGARALVFPQVEDFGLVAAEAQACGTPVIACNAGGAKEIVTDGQTGLLFNGQTPEALMRAVRQFEGLNFDRKVIAGQASRFSARAFTAGIERAVKGLVSRV